jgi:hypothetical protein
MDQWTSPYPPKDPFFAELMLVLTDETGERFNDEELCRLVNTAFWASLATEEGQFASISIAFESPGEVQLAGEARFEAPVPYSVESLAKLSPIFGDRVTHLGVWRGGDGAALVGWGVLNGPTASLTLRSRGPGRIVLRVNGLVVADISPGVSPRVRRRHPAAWDLMISSFLPWDESPAERLITAQLLRFSASAMQHGRGGTLLVVDDDGTWAPSVYIRHQMADGGLHLRETWRALGEVDENPARTRVMDTLLRRVFSQAEVGEDLVRDLTRLEADAPPVRVEEEWFMGGMQTIGRLTAVDGAVVATRGLRLIGFGAKILAQAKPPSRLWVSHPVGELLETDVEETELTGGMRHRSAAQFVQDNPTSLALVASQDGRVTLFHAGHGGVSALACEGLLPMADQRDA